MTIAALALAALTTLTAGAATGAAKAPASFYGVVPQTTLGSSDLERMGNGKVGTLRSWVNWAAIDSEPGTADNNWVSFDPIVLEAARNGVEVLPFIFGTPQWVAKELDNSNCGGAKCSITAPKSGAALDAWESFVGEAVDRYGPNGEFWAEHPEVPETPILAWQIWNEQNSKSFYAPKPSPKGYAKLLAAAARAITSRDAGADVVLGGMAELAGSRKAIPGSEYLADLYRVKGAKKSFDAVAPHPYGASVAKVSSQVELYRKAMKRGGDSGAGHVRDRDRRGVRERRQPAQPRQEGPGEAAEGDLQVLPEEAERLQRRRPSTGSAGRTRPRASALGARAPGC